MSTNIYRIACPHCGRQKQAKPEQAGKRYQCGCGQRVVVPAAQSTRKGSAAKAGSVPADEPIALVEGGEGEETTPAYVAGQGSAVGDARVKFQREVATPSSLSKPYSGGYQPLNQCVACGHSWALGTNTTDKCPRCGLPR